MVAIGNMTPRVDTLIFAPFPAQNRNHFFIVHAAFLLVCVVHDVEREKEWQCERSQTHRSDHINQVLFAHNKSF